jgi:hypothetical protein
VQSLSQQTRSTQCPLEHSASIEQAEPFCVSGLQMPPRQKSPFGQSLFVLQPAHWVAPQICGAHGWVRTPGQEPSPSQNSRSVAVLFVASHDAGRHSTVCPGTVQDVVTVPLHTPSQPVPSPGHAGREPTGLPVTGVQVPGAVGRLHASHWLAQALLQHTPSAQKPVRHCTSALQVAPGAPFAVHLPPAAQ